MTTQRPSKTLWLQGVLLALACAHSTAHAGGHLGWTVRADLEGGGDTVGTVFFTDGSTQSIKTGQGVGLSVGGHYRPEASKFDFSGAVGFKYVTTKADNANINLNRAVVDLRADYYLTDDWWIGAGPVFHSSIKLDADGYGPNQNFGSATGVAALVAWKFVALKYTAITYKSLGQKYDASSVGLSFIGKF